MPRALADINGNPHKGNKNKWTDKLQTRYNVPETTPSPEWVPEVVIINAMFSININPLRQHKTIEQYANLLLRQFVIPYYQHGTN